MTLLYEKNKKNIYTWRAKNLAVCQYHNAKSTIKWRKWNQIKKVFLNILL